jgi:hypothetical protein
VIVDAIDLIGVVLQGGASWPMNLPCTNSSPEAYGYVCDMQNDNVG